ncbi:MAG: SRPBCC domain-containing protein [Chitinophagaceae bacterium]
MKNNNFTTSFLVNNTPGEVYKAVNNVRGWWSQDIEGNTDKLNAAFRYHYKNVHVTKLKLVEMVPGKKVVWLVLDNYFKFTKDNSEWKGTKICFEIEKQGEQTLLRFTHIGLVPAYECYEICRDAWGDYVNKSLHDLITKGKGDPNPKGKEGELNEALIKKFSIQE